MNILLTGALANMTDREFNTSRSRIRVRTTTDGLIAALEEMGHKVTAKIVIPGEDLSMYDQAIIGMSGFFGNTVFHTGGVYWTLSKFPNAILTVNDWRVKSAMKMCNQPGDDKTTWFDNFLKNHNARLSAANKVDDYAGLFNKHRTIIEETKKWFDTATDLTLLFPAYATWNPEKLDVVNPTVRWNPGAFMPQNNYNAFSLFGKNNIHIISAASTPSWSWFKKIDPTWVKGFEEIQAASKWKVLGFGSWNNNAVHELELTTVMAEAKTCIVPSYKEISGVGMWRPRHVICKNIETLVLCDKDEGSFMGEGYGQHTASEIESMSDSQYEDLVKLQAESFKKTVESKEQVFEQLKALF